MEHKEQDQVSINEKVDMKELYIGKHGMFTDEPIETTEGHVYPVTPERPSTGVKSKYPGEVLRKGVVKK